MLDKAKLATAYTLAICVEGFDLADDHSLNLGGGEKHQFARKPSAAKIRSLCQAWADGGDWNDEGEGTDVFVHWLLTKDGDEIRQGSEEIKIEADHAEKIAEACGGDTDHRYERSCGDDSDDHTWTEDGEPTARSIGGTQMTVYSHCRTCGLHRVEDLTGSQKNPGEHDTVEYAMPETWCAECECEECEC